MQFRRSPSSISRSCEHESDSDVIAIARVRLGWTCERHDRDSASDGDGEWSDQARDPCRSGPDKTFCLGTDGGLAHARPPARTRRGEMDTPASRFLSLRGPRPGIARDRRGVQGPPMPGPPHRLHALTRYEN